MVRVGDANYVAVTGCVPATCRSERVLLLIQESGEGLLARLDEGGYSHYYAYGGNWGLAGSTAQILDGAMRALARQRGPVSADLRAPRLLTRPCPPDMLRFA